MSEQGRARVAALVMLAVGVVSTVMNDDVAWAACFVAWAIFTATSFIIGAIEKRER